MSMPSPDMYLGRPKPHHATGDGLEQRIKHQQERSVLQTEIFNQKARYIKKISNLEKTIEELHSKNKDLKHARELEKKNMQY